MSEIVRIFTWGDPVAGQWNWGWECWGCHEEETGFGNASTAREVGDNHAALCSAAAATDQGRA